LQGCWTGFEGRLTAQRGCKSGILTRGGDLRRRRSGVLARTGGLQRCKSGILARDGRSARLSGGPPCPAGRVDEAARSGSRAARAPYGPARCRSRGARPAHASVNRPPRSGPGAQRPCKVPSALSNASFCGRSAAPTPRMRLPGPRIGRSHPLGCGLWSGTSTAPPLGVHADAAGSAARCGRRTFRRGRGPQSWTPGAGSVRRCARARLHEPAVGRITLAAWCPNARGDARGAEGKEERP